MTKRRMFGILLLSAALLCTSCERGAPAVPEVFAYGDGAANAMADFLGVTFINPQYGFDGRECLEEAGERLEKLGTKSVKFYLSPNYKSYYAPYTRWDDYESPAELAASPQFRSFMDRDFHTFFIGAYAFVDDYAVYWRDGFTKEQEKAEYKAIYELTYYLCKQYAGSGKTFILQNWEGDWSTMETPNPGIDPSDEVFARMIRWVNVRQDAVNDARKKAGCEGVRVYHALEVNLVDKARKGGRTVTNDVIPRTYCDYYSYSAYDTEMNAADLGAALDYLKTKVSENRLNGQSRLFIGEFGLPANEFGPATVRRTLEGVIRLAREKQYDYALFWQLYDNEVHDPSVPYTQQYDGNCRGYWLVKPSGEEAPTWDYFCDLIREKAAP